MAKKELDDLQVVMGRMGEAYFFKGEVDFDAIAADADLLADADFAMPITSDGVNFEMGTPDITREKITEGRTWYTIAEKGDDNISFQVPSVATDLNALFVNAKSGLSKKIGNDTHTISCYNTSVPKKVTGAWVFRDKEHSVAIILPKTDNYANLVGATGDAMAYWNVAVTVLPNSKDVDLMIATKTVAGE